MKAADLDRAQLIVTSIKSIDQSLKRVLYPGRAMANKLAVCDDGKTSRSETYLYLSQEVAEKALEMQKDILRQRRSALVREAAQIGLVL